MVLLAFDNWFSSTVVGHVGPDVPPRALKRDIDRSMMVPSLRSVVPLKGSRGLR